MRAVWEMASSFRLRIASSFARPPMASRDCSRQALGLRPSHPGVAGGFACALRAAAAVDVSATRAGASVDMADLRERVRGRLAPSLRGPERGQDEAPRPCGRAFARGRAVRGKETRVDSD